MTDITLRSTKGAPLTHDEVDQNFINLKETADAAFDASAGLGGKAPAAAVGIDDAATNMGTTPGTILSDNGTAKQWFQESEAAIEVAKGVAFQGPTSDASAVSFPTSVDVVKTSGHTTNGDGGDAEYTRVAAPPSHAGYFTDAGGQHFAITKRTVRLSQFGALPSVTDNAAKIAEALFYLNDIGGGCLEIDNEGYYDVASTALLSNLLTHIQIENKAGGIIRGAAGLSSPVMRINGPSSGAAPGMLTIHGLKTDNSQGYTPGGGDYCTGLDLNYLEQVIANGYECFGGDLPANTVSDSGIASVRVRNMILNDCIIRGQGDAAIYPNWDNSGDIDGYVEVNGGVFSRNQQVLSAKRNLRDLVWRGGLLLENRSGITSQWVDNGGWVNPARNVDIDGVVFRKTLANAVQLKGAGKGRITNSRFVDVGYEYNGTGNVGANAISVALHGVPGCYIRNLRFEMQDWVSAQEYAFSVQNDTTSGTISGGKHDIAGCSYSNWYRVSTGSAGNPCRWGRETYPTTAVGVASDHNTASRIDYALTGDARRYTRLGLTSVRETFDTHRAPITVDLSALGTIAAGAQTGVQTVSVPGLTADDNVHLTPLSSTLISNPGIQIAVRPVTDGVQYVVRNAYGSGVSMTSQSIRLSF